MGNLDITATPYPAQALGTTASPTFAKVNLPTGAAGTAGTGTLVAGLATISTTAVTANSIILLTTQVAAGFLGEPTVASISAGASFNVKSVIPGGALTQTSDTSTFSWVIFN